MYRLVIHKSTGLAQLVLDIKEHQRYCSSGFYDSTGSAGSIGQLEVYFLKLYSPITLFFIIIKIRMNDRLNFPSIIEVKGNKTVVILSYN